MGSKSEYSKERLLLDAKSKVSLLSVDQVQRVAEYFRTVAGSPHSPKDRHYLPAGRAAQTAIFFGGKYLLREIALHFSKDLKR